MPDGNMFAAITLIRFRRRWLDVHGPLVCAFPRPRAYAQCHVIDSIAANEDGLTARIDGFPILYFDNETDRLQAHRSSEMAACDIDSQKFVGAVSRVIADVSGPLRAGPGRFSLIELCTGIATKNAAPPSTMCANRARPPTASSRIGRSSWARSRRRGSTVSWPWNAPPPICETGPPPASSSKNTG